MRQALSSATPRRRGRPGGGPGARRRAKGGQAMTMVDVATLESRGALDVSSTGPFGSGAQWRRPAPAPGGDGLGAGGPRRPAPPGTPPGPRSARQRNLQGTAIDTLDGRFKAIIPDPYVLIERVAGSLLRGGAGAGGQLGVVRRQQPGHHFRYRDMVWGPEIILFRYPGGTNIDEERPRSGGAGPQRAGPGRWGACWSRNTATGGSPAPNRTGA